MTNENRKIVVLGLLGLMVSGCIPSRYHMGFHQLSEDQNSQYYSPVSKKVDGLVNEVEQQFINNILKADLSSITTLFSPRLSKQLTSAVINDIDSKLAILKLDGHREVIKVFDGPKFMLTEGVGKAPFDFYDYVGGAYRVSEETNAIVDVYLTQVDSKVLVCGFRITPEKSDSGGLEPIVFLAPESIDKARLVGRYYRTVP